LRTIGGDTLLRRFRKLLRFEVGLGDCLRLGSGQAGFFALLVGGVDGSCGRLLLCRLCSGGQS